MSGNNKDKVERCYINCKINKKVHDKFVEVCNKFGQSKTSGMEKAFVMYIKAVEENPGNAGISCEDFED